MAITEIVGKHPIIHSSLESLTRVRQPVMGRYFDSSNGTALTSPYRSSITLRASTEIKSFSTQKFLAILLSIFTASISAAVYLYKKTPNNFKKMFNNVLGKVRLDAFRDVCNKKLLFSEPIETEAYVK